MSEWKLPKLRKDKNVIVQAKYAVSNIDSIGGILTCLSMEARRNDLGSMAFVLTELADELCKSAEKVDVMIMFAERQNKKKDGS